MISDQQAALLLANIDQKRPPNEGFEIGDYILLVRHMQAAKLLMPAPILTILKKKCDNTITPQTPTKEGQLFLLTYLEKHRK